MKVGAVIRLSNSCRCASDPTARTLFIADGKGGGLWHVDVETAGLLGSLAEALVWVS